MTTDEAGIPDYPCNCSNCQSARQPPAASAGYRRLSGEKLAAILADAGIIEREAIDDPQGYDNGKTLDRIYKVAARL